MSCRGHVTTDPNAKELNAVNAQGYWRLRLPHLPRVFLFLVTCGTLFIDIATDRRSGAFSRTSIICKLLLGSPIPNDIVAEQVSI